jgi:hypothetical protein
MLVKNNGKIACYVTANASVNYDGTGAATIALNQWVHYAITYDSVSGLRGYVNGVLDGSVAANGVLNTNLFSGSPVQQFVGNNQDGLSSRWWDGWLSDLAFYNRAISAGEVAYIYNLGVTGRNSERSPLTRRQWFDATGGGIGGGTGRSFGAVIG